MFSQYQIIGELISTCTSRISKIFRGNGGNPDACVGLKSQIQDGRPNNFYHEGISVKQTLREGFPEPFI